MELIKRTFSFGFNRVFFMWCFALPVAAFVITLFFTGVFADTAGGNQITNLGLKKFLAYYTANGINEFLVIFLNNYMAVLIIVYFGPVALWVRRQWERWRDRETALSALEKILLYVFPAVFLVRQAVNIAVIINGMAASINKNVILMFTGIVLPHGLPEFLVFCVAGAVGMEVTHKMLFSDSPGQIISGRVMLGLLVLIGACAFLEVYFTPRIFAALMSFNAIN